MPLEKTPSAALSTPTEKPPAATPSDASGETRSLWPPTLSEIDAFFARMLRPRELKEPESKSETAAKQPAERRAADQGRKK
jgi:hypothetical protein